MKKIKQYTGDLGNIPGKQILLNVDSLENGDYSLKIIKNNKVLKEITFKK